MTENVGESYSDLGGQLANEGERLVGKLGLQRAREHLKRADKPCPECDHHEAHWHNEDGCTYPTAPRGEPCGCERPVTQREEQ